MNLRKAQTICNQIEAQYGIGATKRKLTPIEFQINEIDFLEVLNKMVELKEMEVFIEGYADDRIHEHDARVELIALYKAHSMIEKEKWNNIFRR